MEEDVSDFEVAVDDAALTEVKKAVVDVADVGDWGGLGEAFLLL